MEEYVCPKCKDTGRIKKEDGSIQTCFDCLVNGRLDQHNKNVKSAEDLKIKL